MRARRGTVVGTVLVALYAVALIAAVVTTRDGELQPGDRAGDPDAVEGFIAAWKRSRTAVFVRFGTFERRSEVTGATIASEDVLAQRPPRRIHRQLGGVDGRDDDRLVLCPAPPAGQPAGPCRLGDPGGPTYAESVATELEGLRSLLEGDQPVYAVARAGEAGCFDLRQRRAEPRAPFGIEARFCFDGDTGAPADYRVQHPGGIVERLAVTEIRSSVAEADLEP